jgi:hypothetical protein
MSTRIPPGTIDVVALVADLFERLGYQVERDVLIAGVNVDLVIEREALRCPVEVKHYAKSLAIKDLIEASARLYPVMHTQQNYVSPIMCIIGGLSPAARQWATARSDLRVWDIWNLRDKARPYDDLRQQFSALAGEVQTADHATEALDQKISAAANEFIMKLRQHELSDGLSPQEYERLCQNTVTFLFDPWLYGFESQAETSDGANRYDFICRIKTGSEFWDAIRADFRTRSILFECKNYSEPITADQVYSTERYLFSGALRTVCLLISRKGPDDGCRRAAQGAMRESGKLVLLLSNAELIRMLQTKAEGDDPTTQLDEMIWDFIIKLPR